MDAWLVNGTPCNHVPVDDRGLAYGDGLFETVAWRDGRARFLDRHLERLTVGCRRLDLPKPDSGLICSEIEQLGSASPEGIVKILITRGSGPRGYAAPSPVAPTRIVGWSGSITGTMPGAVPAARVIVCRTPASVNPYLAGLKTLNRLDNVLASLEWREAGCNEGLMLDPAGRVIGGTMSNVFMVRGCKLLTPSIEHCGIHGVMRAIILSVARESGIAVEEQDLRLEDFARAEEIFLSNALWGVRPVHDYIGRRYVTGSLTREIGRALTALGVSECPC